MCPLFNCCNVWPWDCPCEGISYANDDDVLSYSTTVEGGRVSRANAQAIQCTSMRWRAQHTYTMTSIMGDQGRTTSLRSSVWHLLRVIFFLVSMAPCCGLVAALGRSTSNITDSYLQLSFIITVMLVCRAVAWLLVAKTRSKFLLRVYFSHFCSSYFSVRTRYLRGPIPTKPQQVYRRRPVRPREHAFFKENSSRTGPCGNTVESLL